MTQLLTTQEACARLRVSRWTLARKAKYHNVKPRRIGRAVRWTQELLDVLVERASKVRR